MIKKPLSTVISLVKAGLHAAKYGYPERPPNKIKLKQYQVNLASLDLGKSMIPLKM
jgi:hypothetical protein